MALARSADSSQLVRPAPANGAASVWPAIEMSSRQLRQHRRDLLQQQPRPIVRDRRTRAANIGSSLGIEKLDAQALGRHVDRQLAGEFGQLRIAATASRICCAACSNACFSCRSCSARSSARRCAFCLARLRAAALGGRSRLRRRGSAQPAVRRVAVGGGRMRGIRQAATDPARCSARRRDAAAAARQHPIVRLPHGSTAGCWPWRDLRRTRSDTMRAVAERGADRRTAVPCRTTNVLTARCSG